MGGRRAQPIDIIKAKGKSHHLTKKEIERRKKAEIIIEEKKLTIPEYVKNDIEALKKWKEIVELYKNIDVICGIDSTTLGRYCKHFSEYIDLINRKKMIEKISMDFETISISLQDSISEQLEVVFKSEVLNKMENLINKKSQLLMSFEDRLFLNPVSRLKNVAKKEKEEKDPEAYMFGD